MEMPSILHTKSPKGRRQTAIFFMLGLSCSLILFNATSASARTIPTSHAQVVQLVAAGQTIERDLAGGELHAYRIAVRSGDYVGLLVEPGGIELKLKLPSSV